MKQFTKNAFVSVALVGSLIGTPTAILTSNAKYQNLALFAPQNPNHEISLPEGLKGLVGADLGQNKPPSVYSPAPTSPETKKFLKFLRSCESGGKDDIIILDSNNKLSYGRYQFQLATFVSAIRYYGMFPEVEDKELENLILDPQIQDDLAGRLVEDSQQRHWLNCWNKYKKL